MKQLLKQTWNLMLQNRFHAMVSIIGTSVTIAFVMVVTMIYDFRTSNIAPEANRSQMMYTDAGSTYRRDNHANVNRGMGPVAFDALFSYLPGVEEVTWYRGISKSPCSLPASTTTYNYFMRPVALNWFSFFQYEFIAGRPFTKEEYDAKRWVCVISEHMARQLFGTTDVVGKEFLTNFFPTKVVGVVRDVSSIFQTAYGDAFLPFSLENEDSYQTWTAGVGGIRLGLLKLAPESLPDAVRAEVQNRQDRFNATGQEYVFEMRKLYTQTDYTFFRNSTANASLVYGMLILILLVVPAISISGLMHAQMQSRLTEIAVRKAYGASNFSIVGHLFAESLTTTFLGGILGYLLSCILIWLGRTWLFGTGGVDLGGITFDGSLLLHPALFFMAFGVCVVFNLLSVGLPAWMAVHRSITVTLKGE